MVNLSFNVDELSIFFALFVLYLVYRFWKGKKVGISDKVAFELHFCQSLFFPCSQCCPLGIFHSGSMPLALAGNPEKEQSLL